MEFQGFKSKATSEGTQKTVTRGSGTFSKEFEETKNNRNNESPAKVRELEKNSHSNSTTNMSELMNSVEIDSSKSSGNSSNSFEGNASSIALEDFSQSANMSTLTSTNDPEAKTIKRHKQLRTSGFCRCSDIVKVFFLLLFKLA